MCQSGIKCHCKQSSGSDVHAHCSQQKWCKEREEYISGGKNTQEQGQLSPTVLDVVAAVIYVASSYGCIMKAAARTEVGHHKIKMFENTWSKHWNMFSFVQLCEHIQYPSARLHFYKIRLGIVKHGSLGKLSTVQMKPLLSVKRSGHNDERTYSL